MKILGIESSSRAASVAYLQDDVLVAEYTVNYKLTHSQTLLPMLDEITSRVEFDPATLDAIAISAGPGSFTGLRIGAATAKGLGLALDKPLISVPTLDAMAYNMYMSRALVCPMLDARRGQVYAGVYAFAKDMERVREPECILTADLADRLNEYGREIIFLGDGTENAAPVLKEKLSVAYSFAPANLNSPRAGSVAALGAHYYMEGKTMPAEEFAPQYLRMSQAEQYLEAARKEGRVDELKAGHMTREDNRK